MVDRGPKDKNRRRRGRKGSKDFTEPSAAAATAGSDLSTYQPHNSLLIQLDENASTWYQYGKQSAGRDATIVTDPPSDNQKNTSDMINKYRSLADSIYRREVQLFAKNGNSSDEKWVESTMKKGTLKDRVAAMSVVVSADPIHKFFALDGLLQMAGCAESGSHSANSRVAHLAAEALEDLFLNTFLPSDRKLMTLSNRPLYLYEEETSSSPKKKKTKNTLSPRILLLWRFEEMVKDKYQLFLRQYMGRTLRDGVEQQKVQALRTVANLLRSVPEAESTLLQLIVNKLGDPEKKTAAQAGHELRKVLQQHPVMQVVVAREVQQLVHRPHLSPKALYCCIIFLNQLKLDRSEVESTGPGEVSLPASLISTYFRLFEVAVKKPKTAKKGDNTVDIGMQSRLLSALLTGVNRAHPYLPAKDQKLEEHVDSLYRVVHAAPPAASTQALLLLFHLAIGSDQDGSAKKQSKTQSQLEQETARHERFYRAVYSTLSQPAVLGTGKHLTMFFNLLYKTMKNDTNVSRVIAFAKRVMCTTLHCNPSVTAASLFLLNEVSKYHPALLSCFQEVLEGTDALRVLDPTKRDPRGALVSTDDKGKESGTLKRAPGWELTLTLHHFHPSVAKFASSLGEIQYSGDPLKDFGLAPFLDKFAYRNPKSVDRVVGKYKSGQSVAERRSGTENTIQSHFSLPLNDPSFLQKEDVGEQDEFFHKFFVERAKRDEMKGVERHVASQDENTEEAEIDALDENAARDADQSPNVFDYQWDSDPEEEEFVDSLAQSIMEDSVDGPLDLEEEDPDMEGWDDMYGSDDDDDENTKKVLKQDADSDDDEEAALVDQEDDEADIDDEDEDAFMDASDDDSDGEAGTGEFANFEMEGGDDDEDSADDDDGNHGGSSDDQEHDLALLAGSDSSSDEDEAPPKKEKSKKKKEKFTSTFADADEYEEMISNSWNDIKRTRQQAPDEDETEAVPEGSAEKKKSKRRKR